VGTLHADPNGQLSLGYEDQVLYNFAAQKDTFGYNLLTFNTAEYNAFTLLWRLLKIRKTEKRVYVIHYELVKFWPPIFAALFYLLAPILLRDSRSKIVYFYHGPLVKRISLHQASLYSGSIRSLQGLAPITFFLLYNRMLRRFTKHFVDLVVTFVPSHCEFFKPRSVLIDHGTPTSNRGNDHIANYDAISPEFLTFFGAISPRKSITTILPAVAAASKSLGLKVLMMGEVSPYFKGYRETLDRVARENGQELLWESIRHCDFLKRIKFLSKSVVIIPYLTDQTPVYSMFDVLAFTHRVLVLSNADTRNSLPSFISTSEKHCLIVPDGANDAPEMMNRIRDLSEGRSKVEFSEPLPSIPECLAPIFRTVFGQPN